MKRGAPAFLALMAACTVEGRLGTDPSIPSRLEGPESPVPTFACAGAVDLGRVAPEVVAERTVQCRVGPGFRESVVSLRWVDGGHRGFRVAPSVDGTPVALPLTLGSAQGLDLRIRFESLAPGEATGTLRVQRASGPPVDIDARALVDRNEACDLRAFPPVLDFGATSVGGEAVGRVRIENAGPSLCQASAVLMPGSDESFRLEAGGPFGIPPGASVLLEVGYRAREGGRPQGVLALYGERQVLLRGVPLRAYADFPPAIPSVEPTTLDFGRRALACINPTVREVHVTAGERDLVIRGELTEDTSPDFHLLTETATLAGGQTGVFRVALRPERTGTAHGRLKLSGEGLPPHYVELGADIGDDSVTEQRFVGPPPYRLAGPPVDGTMEVRLDGRVLPRTWEGFLVWAVDYVERELVLVSPPRREDARIDARFEQVCVLPTCGDGVVDPGEACDDGNAVETDACLSSCMWAYCGDGFVRADEGEECDDGNSLSGDGCNVVCQLERCGNGIIEPPEECDTGELRSATEPNACRLDCRAPRCGDGVTDVTEACDDGNTDPTDACIECRAAVCGDGFVHAGVEACDDGNRRSGDACEPDCTLPVYEVVVETGQSFPPSPPVSTHPLDQPITLPYTFDFLGHPVSTLDASQRGLLVFGSAPPTADNTALPSRQRPDQLIAWWWDDTDQIGASYLYTVGPPGFRVTVLRFEEIVLLRGDGTRAMAEVRLYERSGRIAVHYGPLVSESGLNAGSASVGWEADPRRGADILGCSPHCASSDWPAGEIHIYQR